MAAGRLQRWAIFLAMYDYQIVYKKGSKLGNADALSRLPLAEENEIEHRNIHSFSEEVPIDVTIIANKISNDPVLSKVYTYVATSWPNTVDEPYRVYFNKKLMLGAEAGCLYYGNRIVIPSSLRKKALDQLHSTHIGTVRMKLLAKRYIWWPNLDSDIEQRAKTCEACQLNQSSPSPVKLYKWKEATYVFERVHLDFFHFDSARFLIIIDAYSRWLDVKIMNSTNCAKLIEEVRHIIAYFGIPTTIVADNGPPFNSAEFKTFCSSNAITYKNSPPYHPQSNGWAERAVRTVKGSLKKMVTDHKTKSLSLALKVDAFLFKYRNTPVTTTNECPNALIFLSDLER